MVFCFRLFLFLIFWLFLLRFDHFLSVTLLFLGGRENYMLLRLFADAQVLCGRALWDGWRNALWRDVCARRCGRSSLLDIRELRAALFRLRLD